MARRRRREEPETEPVKKNPIEKVAGMLEVPQSAISKTAQMQIIGNREVIIDGAKGVLEYTEDCIRISLGKQVVRFMGRSLTLKGLSDESIIIEGFILSIEFMQ